MTFTVGCVGGLGVLERCRKTVTDCLTAAVPPTIYYSKVAIELSKLVFRGQKMTPP